MIRSMVRPAQALTIAVLAVTVAACQSSAPAGPTALVPVTAIVSSSPNMTVAPVPAAGPHGVPDAAFAGAKPFTGPAVARYGQPVLQSAYKEMVNFAFLTGWNSAMIARDSARLSRADLAVTLSYLTPAAQKEVLATLVKVVQGDMVASTSMEQYMFFGVTGPHGMRSVQSGKVVTNRRFSQASVGVDTSKGIRLSMAFAARGDIQMLDTTGNHLMMRTSRTLQYLLVPNTGPSRSERPFLVDAWTIKMTVTPPVAVG